MGVMAILEMLMGSKVWEAVKGGGVDADNLWEFSNTKEFTGFVAHGFPEMGGQLIMHPGLLSQTLNGLVPPHIREQMEFSNELYSELMYGSTGAYSGNEYGAEVVALELILLIIDVLSLNYVMAANAVESMAGIPDKFDKEMRNLLEENSEHVRIFVETWDNRLRTWARALNVSSGSFPDDQGTAYVAANPYFKVDTDKLRSCAERAVNLRNRLDKLENDLQRTVQRVPIESRYLFSWVSSILDGCPKLDKVNSYLNFTADRFEIAESRALDFMQPGSGRTASSRSGSGQSGSGRAGSYAPIKGKARGGQHGR